MSVFKYRDKRRVQIHKRNARSFDGIFASKKESLAAEREHLL
jgi:hypothetical protein